jgi:WD40 repeat protein
VCWFCICFCLDGRLITCGTDKLIKIYTDNSLTLTLTSRSSLLDVQTLSSTRIITSSTDRTLRIWNISTSYCESSVEMEEVIDMITVLPDERILAHSVSGKSYIWCYNEALPSRVHYHDAYIVCMLMKPTLSIGRIYLFGKQSVLILFFSSCTNLILIFIILFCCYRWYYNF